jgi:methionyl-tRNA formyltransferase
LPRYRGPNPLRQIYAGERHFAATLHRIAPDFDAGPILAQVSRPIPDEVTMPTIGAMLADVLTATLEEGLAAAIDGAPGIPQDETLAHYAGPFTEAERWLDWHLPRSTLQRRAVVLNFDGPAARGVIGGEDYLIERVIPLRESTADGPLGTILERGEGTFTIMAADGPVLVDLVAP